MDVGCLYFIKDEFYEKYSNCGLLGNKREGHGHPCCYSFKLNKEDNIYWMIPISSKTKKYQEIYDKTIKKYGLCDNISFGYVLGKKKAFLLQNMFPVTENYIDNIYIDPNTHKPIRMPRNLIAELNFKARKKYKYNFSGKKMGLSDIVFIYNDLLSSNI